MLTVDLHTHTVSSGHGFSTLLEMIEVASERGVRILGVTEHGPSMAGAPHPTFFNMAPRLPGRLGRVALLSGVEANILDFSGRLDLPADLLAVQDIVIAGLHEFTPYPAGAGVDRNTEAVLGAIADLRVDVIAHPYRPEFPVHVEPVVEAAARAGVLLEVSVSLLGRPDRDRKTDEAYRLLIELMQARGRPLLVSTDAHIATELGDDSALELAGVNVNPLETWHPGSDVRTRLRERLLGSPKEALRALPGAWSSAAPGRVRA